MKKYKTSFIAIEIGAEGILGNNALARLNRARIRRLSQDEN